MKTGEFYELRFEKFGLRVPKEYWYAGYDTWAKVDGEEVTVGVTDFLGTKLGDIVYVIPAQAESFEEGDVLASLESVKATVDITCPAGGTVVAFNPALDEHPELVNTDPFGEGWIAKLRLTDWEGDKAMLLSSEAYFRLMQGKVAKELERA